MRQASLRLLEPLADVTKLAEALGLSRMTSLPIRSRSRYTGAAHLMVRVSEAETVDKAGPRLADCSRYVREAQAEGCYIYAF